MDDEDTAALLIEQAMSGVVVVACPACGGKGTVRGDDGIEEACLRCGNAGKVVGNAE